MSKRCIEAVKTLIIALLMFSAVFLAVKSELYNGLILSVPALSQIAGELSASRKTASYAEGRPVISSAAVPVYVVVTSKYGDHCAIKYDGSALNAFYGRISGLLGEVLTLSSKPEEVGEEEWRLALSSVGLFLDFDNPLPLSSVIKSGDSKISGDRAANSVRRLCIASYQNRVYLYFINESDKIIYRALTTVGQTTLAAYLSEYLPNGANFAFEMGQSYKDVDPYAVLMKTTKVFSASAVNPLYDKITKEKILEQFGINSLLGWQYYESSGSFSFVTEQYTLRINSDGSVSYRVTGSASTSLLKIKSAGPVPADYEVLESARNLVLATVGSVCGSASLQLTGFEYEADKKSGTLTFDYYVNGIPVKTSPYRHAATIGIVGSRITSVQLFFRNYTLLESLEKVMPERQAAVLVSPYKEPALLYLDDGKGRLEPSWTEK